MGDIELTGFGDLLRGIGLLYWGLALGALYLAARNPTTRLGKGLATAVVLGLFVGLPLSKAWQTHQERAARAAHIAQGDARFKAYCQKAGVKIHRVVEGVEGIYLMKVRTIDNQNNQYEMTDPYGDDAIGEYYIRTFLRSRNNKGEFSEGAEDIPGYRFVEAIDPKDGKLYRFTSRIERPGLSEPDKYAKDYVRFVLEREPIAQRKARYGVTYDDVSTKEDRDYWIAGSSLRVVDLETNEVIAERIGYMMDYGQGPDHGARQGWTYAESNACPVFPGDPKHPLTAYQTRNFVEQSLHTAK